MNRLVQVSLLFFLSSPGNHHHVDAFAVPRVATHRTLQSAAAGGPLRAMELWIDVRDHDVRTQGNIATSRLNDCDKILKDINEEFADLPDAKAGFLNIDGDLLWNEKDDAVGKVIDVSSPKGQKEGLAAIGTVDWILAEATSDGNWKQIPAENLIANAKNGGTKIAFTVEKQGDIIGLSKALELGVDALCIRSDVDETFWEAARAAATYSVSKSNKIEVNQGSKTDTTTTTLGSPTIIEGAVCKSDKNAVLADRVCVDFVQMLKAEEGCWIGSSSQMLALVLSEAAVSNMAPSRPFRINGGPVHSYILMGDGTLKYLSELEAGDEVAVYNTSSSEEKPVAVGRLKVESRPCCIFNLLDESSGQQAQVLLQQAETVRLGLVDGDFVRATDLDTSHYVPGTLLRTAAAGADDGDAYGGTMREY